MGDSGRAVPLIRDTIMGTRKGSPFNPHRTDMSTITTCVQFFLPTDARHWIPNGTAYPELQIDSEIAEYAGDADWYDAIEFAAEQWCEMTHGKGSFFRVIWED